MSKKSLKELVKPNLMQKKQQIDEALQLAELEYQKIIAEAETHIEASKKIIETNGLVPVIQFSEEGLLSLLKQLYVSGQEKIQITNPQIIYEIKALIEPEPEPEPEPDSEPTESQEAQEVEYEIVEEKVISL